VRRRQSVVFVESRTGFRYDGSGKIYPTFGFALEKAKAVRSGVTLNCNDILAAHRHLAVVFPS